MKEPLPVSAYAGAIDLHGQRFTWTAILNIGYRFDEDSGANFITLYGWGYDKNMPKSDPAHLVE
ncbi:hypothetical protein [Paraglaciecola hydrolytica]|uniref:Uncharacterized protein n=1 Tax=Paraglaciecola hydrolytica TaxID=1799789 RepID=A0A148KL15_9ALTE|nr:hypothetical protein [Paraglaciecola hydrolytica]KXI26961.1 hypothetical protein AX660_02350 [Paraglaciecola hydrolytica]